MDIENQIKQLLIRFLNNQCTIAEEQQVNLLLEDPNMMELLHQLILEQDNLAEQLSSRTDERLSPKMKNWQKQIAKRIADSDYITNEKPLIRSIRSSQWLRYAAIFIGLTVLAGSSWLWFSKSALKGDQQVQLKDISPGGNKATLTLIDGSVISLSDVPKGTIATQEGVLVEKTENGEILYHTDVRSEQATAMNTISTLNGGQYLITLPDGSTARLNAASSLSYPVRFNKHERRVKMTGEIYFEISKIKLPNHKGNLPFVVETDKQEIQVLGTHFNVNAYKDEPSVRTTLVEGCVRIQAHNGQSALLQPGQQAVLTESIQVEDADIQQQLAWKNGDFIFRGESLESLLRQVSRWYDVVIECPPHLGKIRFNGMVSRSQPLSVIVEMIQSTKKTKVTLKERRLIVTD